MELVTADWTFAAEVEALVEQGQRLPFRALVRVFLADEDLDLTSQQTTDRGGAPSRDDLGLLNGFAVEADGYVLLRFLLLSLA